MAVYRLFLVVDAAALFLAVYFLFAGVGDGSVSSFNIALWLALLTGMTAISGVGYNLKIRRRTRTAMGVLAIVAVPAILSALFLLSILIAQPRWS